jgi:hypothetical protein
VKIFKRCPKGDKNKRNQPFDGFVCLETMPESKNETHE